MLRKLGLIALALIGLALASVPARSQVAQNYWACGRNSVTGSLTWCPAGSQYPYPTSSVQAPANSTNVLAGASPSTGNTQDTVTLTPSSTTTAWICGFTATIGGNTAGQRNVITVSGVLGGTQSYVVAVQIGSNLTTTQQQVFSPCIPATAVNTPIVVTSPSAGAGNGNQALVAWGYQQ